MSRAFLVVMDSVGCGGAPDAAVYGDEGANTLGHIAEICAQKRGRPFTLPYLDRLGLGAALKLSTGKTPPGLGAEPIGLWGVGREKSAGKDTPSGHWELAGVPVPWTWHVFPKEAPTFPADLVDLVQRTAQVEGILGNCHASGTEIIARLGAEHLRSGWPICYTSADSVFQIAAHEAYFGLPRLLKLCEAIAPHLHTMRVGRVIARPFVGEITHGFTRTKNRRDFAMLPPKPTLCDMAQAAGRETLGLGKIGDIFSARGLSKIETGTDAELMQDLHHAVNTMPEGSLTFANFVEFDSLYGHRRDVMGYAKALEGFDTQIESVARSLRPDDLLLLTADHGNDPSWPGTDHTREQVPILGSGAKTSGSIGIRGLSDVAASVAAHLGIAYTGDGEAFL